MKNAKKIGIVIVQVVIAGILVFIAIKTHIGNKSDDIDIGQVAVEDVEQTSVPSATATPESATSETANADGYGEETLMQTEDGSYLDGEASDDEKGLSDEEKEQPAATATPAPVATATPQPAQATAAPVQNDVPQQTANQPDQSYDQTVDDLWTDDAWVSDDEYNEAMDAMSGLEFE